jgi:ADP-ribosylglycohydrolase
LQNAFYQLPHADYVSIGTKASALAGGDLDTNVAIAGALLGVYGVNAMPRQWLQALVSA